MINALLRSMQHYLQKPRYGNNPYSSIEKQIKMMCFIYIQWNIAQP